MPISTPSNLASEYGGDLDHFEHVLRFLFEPAIKHAGYNMVSPSVLNSQIIQAEIIRNLETADLVLCDISGWNANVFFELGIRVALDRPAALIKDSRTPNIPFDNALVSCHTYDSGMTPWCLEAETEKLAKFVRSAGMQDRNALWKYFGITQRASIPSAGDPVQEKLDLILASLQRPDPAMYSREATVLPGETGWVQWASGSDPEWMVHHIPGEQAVKSYRCPGCDHKINPGTAHTVVLPAGQKGVSADRRHWHSGCWTARWRREPPGRPG
jgi:hypothetical protein